MIRVMPFFFPQINVRTFIQKIIIFTIDGKKKIVYNSIFFTNSNNSIIDS